MRSVGTKIELFSSSIKSKHCPYSFPRTELVAQVEFTEWRRMVTHSKFVGLREDKEAREIVREIERQL
jgi:ATP-dependent DNA ligase